MEKIKIIIADDHPLIRQGICKVLELDKDLLVVAEVSNGIDLLEKMAEFAADIILLDINMPGENGIELTKKIKEKYSKVKIIILTIHDDEDYIF